MVLGMHKYNLQMRCMYIYIWYGGDCRCKLTNGDRNKPKETEAEGDKERETLAWSHNGPFLSRGIESMHITKVVLSWDLPANPFLHNHRQQIIACVYMYISPSSRIFPCMHALRDYMHAVLHAFREMHMHALCIRSSLVTRLWGFLHAVLHAVLHAALHSCMHACMQSSVHAFMQCLLACSGMGPAGNMLGIGEQACNLWFFCMHACMHACKRSAVCPE